MAADVHAVVTELGLRRPAIVGISLGGTIALRYTLDYPEDLLAVCSLRFVRRRTRRAPQVR